MIDYADVTILGGGAAGIFAALAAKDAAPHARVVVLEKTARLLSKVRVSGGGRCNVTHACFEPRQLVQNYPRGSKELLGPFTRFQPQNTVDWFQSRGVILKTEEDGRMFPITDSSETIIEALLDEGRRLQVEILTLQNIQKIVKNDDDFLIDLKDQKQLKSKSLILATGSHPQGLDFAKHLGHTIVEPVPSLFTFNIPAFTLKELAGTSVGEVTVKLKDSSLSQKGPVLITHWGFSGPAILKLSAWGARFLHAHAYKATIHLNWLLDLTQEEVLTILKKARTDKGNASSANTHLFPQFSKNLWRRFLELAQCDPSKKLSEFRTEDMQRLSLKLTQDEYHMDGKTTHKEEFVTCGGVSLKEVDFKKMESRICPHLYFAGEILDIDGVTGGFNFQNAWTTGWIAGRSAAAIYRT